MTSSTHGILPWVLFNAFVLAMLAIDLGIFHRKAHEVPVREAAGWTAVWVSLSLIFNFGVYRVMGAEAGLQFLTAYLVEYALSVDNIFIFVLIFGYFRVPRKYQHRVLFWGIIGAIVMRGSMIAAGTILLERFEWVIYVFGAFLVITGIRMAKSGDETMEIEANPIIRLLRKFVPITSEYHGQRFLVREHVAGVTRHAVTPLFVVLAMIETTDLIFALDSIPAVFAVTRDPFLVYTSNLFAILGLRSLYFLLAGVIHKLHYLKVGLAFILVFVGTKMLIHHYYAVPTLLSLGVIATVLILSGVASLMFPKQVEENSPLQKEEETVGDKDTRRAGDPQ